MGGAWPVVLTSQGCGSSSSLDAGPPSSWPSAQRLGPLACKLGRVHGWVDEGQVPGPRRSILRSDVYISRIPRMGPYGHPRGLRSQFTTGQPGIHDLLQRLWFRRETWGQGVLPGVPIL